MFWRKRSNSECAYPWTHFTVHQGEVLPCCNFGGAGFKITEADKLETILDHDFFADMRRKMTVGKAISGCSRCYNQELNGGRSMRTIANETFHNSWESPAKLRYLQFSLGNLCNLKCRSCSSSYSTKWARDEIRLGKIPAQPITAALKQLDGVWDSLTHIKLIGGEPMLSPQHEEFLREAKSRGLLPKLNLDYATNGTVRVSPFVLDSWNQLESLKIAVSIDDVRERNDFFREGSKWADVLENVRWYRDNVRGKNVQFRFHTVVNVYNVSDIVQIDDWLAEDFPEFLLIKDCLIDPSWLNIANLPDAEKQILTKFYKVKMSEFGDERRRRTGYGKIVNFLNSKPNDSFESFIREDRKLNDLQGYDSTELRPRLRQMIQDFCKSPVSPGLT